MRYYMGVDWADDTDAVWVVDEGGATVQKRPIAHTAAARSEWARWLRECQAEGIEVWAAIERPHGRIVDFLLDHGEWCTRSTPRVWIARAIGFASGRARVIRSTHACWRCFCGVIMSSCGPCGPVRRQPRN